MRRTFNAMDTALAQTAVEERFDPSTHGSSLMAVEHLVRYQSVASIVRGKRVLDIAAGSGWGSRLLLEAGAAEVIGVDIEPTAVESASAVYGNADDISFRVGDLLALDDDLGQFDLIVCFETLEHVTDSVAAIRSLKNRLAPDGTLVCSVPNAEQELEENHFHLVDFDLGRFSGLIHSEFSNAVLYTQYRSLASFLRANEISASPVLIEHQQVAAEPPVAFLAACSLAADIPTLRPLTVLGTADDLRYWVKRGLEGAARDAEFRALQRANARKEQELQDLVAEHRKLEAGYQDVQQALDDALSAVSVAQKDIFHLNQQIETTSAEAALYKARQLQAIAALETADERLSIELQERERVVLDEAGRRTDELADQIDHLRRTASEQRDELAAIKRTISWRMTRPLRIARLLERRLHR